MILYNLVVASSPRHRNGRCTGNKCGLPSFIAKIPKDLNYKLIQISIVMVFSDLAKCPVYPDSELDANDGHDSDKFLAAKMILIK